jgi:voltage-gated potassium channel
MSSPPRRRNSKQPTVLSVIRKDPKKCPAKYTSPPDCTPRGLTLPLPKKFSFVYTLLNPNCTKWQAVAFKSVISTVILVDLVSFILSTEPSLQDYSFVFQFIEGLSSTVFLVEYLARVATCVEKQKYAKKGPILGRLRFMVSISAIIDAMSMLPFFMEPLVGFELPRLTYLRFLRLLKITKTNSCMRATDAVYRVVYYNREILYVAVFVCVLLVLGTGLLLYYLKPKDPEDAEHFKSILATMYLTTLLLTGQGGPEGELPWYTKAVVLLTSIVSVAMFSIPASMLTWGFEAEAERMAKRAYARAKRVREGADPSDDEYSTDEEYQKIMAGEDGDDGDGDDDEDEWQRELLSMFQKADTDGSGSISLKEFIALSSAAKSEGGGGPVLASLLSRVKQLELEMQTNSKKLDRILQLLETKKNK